MISTLGQLAIKAGMSMIMKVVTAETIEWAILYVVRLAVKSTKTTIDDEIYLKIEAVLKGKDKKDA